jgi:hypothetical protein
MDVNGQLYAQAALQPTKEPPVNTRTGGSHSWFGLCRQEANLFVMSQLEIQLLGCPARSTILYRLRWPGVPMLIKIANHYEEKRSWKLTAPCQLSWQDTRDKRKTRDVYLRSVCSDGPTFSEVWKAHDAQSPPNLCAFQKITELQSILLSNTATLCLVPALSSSSLILTGLHTGRFKP